MNEEISGRVATITEKALAPHSSILAWKIASREELVGRSPWGCKESDTAERLNPRDGSLVGCHLWVHTELDTADVT